MNNKVCLITIISVLVLVLGIYLYKNNKENFTTVNVHPDRRFGLLLREQLNNNAPENTNTDPDPTSDDDHTHSLDLSKFVQKSQIIPNQPKVDLSQYIKKTDVEMAADQISKKYCPVDRNFDINDYVKKSEIPPPNSNCPPVPDLRDFVLKSTVPPVQKCPPCICPKVKVAAGMCKKCPPADTTKCPPPKPCDVRQCKPVIKCPDGKRGCPKPAPCPSPVRCKPCPVKVCPSVKIPTPDKIKCPPSKPCAAPPPCPKVERCEPKKEKCEYKGVKEVEVVKEVLKDRPMAESLRALIENGGTNSRKELKKLANMLETMSPSSIESLGKLNQRNQELQDKINALSNQNENLRTQPDANTDILSSYEGNAISDGLIQLAAEKARLEGRLPEVREAVRNNNFEFLIKYINENNRNNVRNNQNNVRNNQNNVRNNQNNVRNNFQNMNNSALNRINRGLLKLINNDKKERTYQLTQLINRNIQSEEDAINNLGGENTINNVAENITNGNLPQNQAINNLLNQNILSENSNMNNLNNNINNINMANNDFNMGNNAMNMGNNAMNMGNNAMNMGNNLRNTLSEEETLNNISQTELNTDPGFINQILEEESIRRQLGENDTVTPKELNRIRELAPKTLKQCSPVKPIHRYNNFGLLGSIFN